MWKVSHSKSQKCIGECFLSCKRKKMLFVVFFACFLSLHAVRRVILKSAKSIKRYKKVREICKIRNKYALGCTFSHKNPVRSPKRQVVVF